MKTIYELYKVDFIKHNANELTIEAQNRHGAIYTAHLIRQEAGRHWFGGSGFGASTKLTFPGIIREFFKYLTEEVKEHDRDFYRFKCYTTDGRDLTWSEACYGEPKHPAPTFEGGARFYTEQ